MARIINCQCFHTKLDKNSGPNYLKSLPVSEKTVTLSISTPHSAAVLIFKLILKTEDG